MTWICYITWYVLFHLILSLQVATVSLQSTLYNVNFIFWDWPISHLSQWMVNVNPVIILCRPTFLTLLLFQTYLWTLWVLLFVFNFKVLYEEEMTFFLAVTIEGRQKQSVGLYILLSLLKLYSPSLLSWLNYIILA